MTDVTHVDRASQAWLTDPTVFEVNRTPAHSSHKWYARDPQSGQWSDLKQSLDGEWRVEVVQAADINLEEEPATAESFDDSSFERIQVPGHLQTAGLMNHKYVNVQYPWDGHENPLEPNIPENNHVALYRRKFTVSAPVANAKQAGGSVSIVFHGMATAIYVWVNGAFVGYGVDYTKLGTITADMVVQVLVDGKDPATLPVTTFDNGIAMINTESCAALGYDLAAVKQAFDGKCSSVLETTTQQNFD